MAEVERMEAGMEPIAEQIGRIGGGQRFTARLLNGREPRARNKVNAATGRA